MKCMLHVLSTFPTMKTPNFPTKNAPKFCWGGISSVSDYSAFGVQLENRVFEGQGFRYGFQNQEEDSETGLVNYKYRMHDPRIGRFFAIDPLSAKYPYNSPYAFSENITIHMVELEGLESAIPEAEEESRHLTPINAGGISQIWVGNLSTTYFNNGLRIPLSQMRASTTTPFNQTEKELIKENATILGEALDHLVNDFAPGTFTYKSNEIEFLGKMRLMVEEYNLQGQKYFLFNKTSIIFSRQEDKDKLDAAEAEYYNQLNIETEKLLIEMGYGQDCIPCLDKGLESVPEDIRASAEEVIRIKMGPSPLTRLLNTMKSQPPTSIEPIYEEVIGPQTY